MRKLFASLLVGGALTVFATPLLAAVVENEATGFRLDLETLDEAAGQDVPLCVVLPGGVETTEACAAVDPQVLDIMRAGTPATGASGGYVMAGALASEEGVVTVGVVAVPSPAPGPLTEAIARATVQGQIDGAEQQGLEASFVEDVELVEGGPTERYARALIRVAAPAESNALGFSQDKVVYVLTGGTWIFMVTVTAMRGDIAPFRPMADALVEALEVPPVATDVSEADVSEKIAYTTGQIVAYVFIGILVIALGVWVVRKARSSRAS